MIDSALKLTIPIGNTSGENFQMGGRRKKSRAKRGGANDIKLANKIAPEIAPEVEIEDEVGIDYSILDKIPMAKDKDKDKYKDEDETILLAKIAEEGRGGPELYTSMIQEEGRAGPPSFEVKRSGRGGASRKRKNRTKQKRGKSKKSRKGKSKKLRRGKY